MSGVNAPHWLQRVIMYKPQSESGIAEGMSLARDIGGEVVKALVVLALFLSFAYQSVQLPAFAEDGAVWSVADYSNCVSGHNKSDASHTPCHACRPDLAVLPPPPSVVVPAYLSFIAVGCPKEIDISSSQAAYSLPNPRAPPALT